MLLIEVSFCDKPLFNGRCISLIFTNIHEMHINFVYYGFYQKIINNIVTEKNVQLHLATYESGRNYQYEANMRLTER